MLKDTAKFKIHDIIYNKGGFAIARGYWEGGNTLSLACRWDDEEEGIDFPKTFGHSQWLIIPAESVQIVNALHKPEEAKVAITFA